MSTRYLVMDTETTGLEPRQGHKIIEIGCVEVVERKLTGNNYQQYLNPEREIDEGALEVHGIELADLVDKPTFGQIADDFLEYIRGATLVIHNAAFDVGFLNHELALLERELGSIADYCEVEDTLLMARKMHPGQRNSLDALCQRYFISNEHRTLHGALLDSEILAEVFLRMTGGQLNLLGEQGQEENEHQEVELVKVLDPHRTPLRVITPSADELTEHDRWMQILSKSKGETVDW